MVTFNECAAINVSKFEAEQVHNFIKNSILLTFYFYNHALFGLEDLAVTIYRPCPWQTNKTLCQQSIYCNQAQTESQRLFYTKLVNHVVTWSTHANLPVLSVLAENINPVVETSYIFFGSTQLLLFMQHHHHYYHHHHHHKNYITDSMKCDSFLILYNMNCVHLFMHPK